MEQPAPTPEHDADRWSRVRLLPGGTPVTMSPSRSGGPTSTRLRVGDTTYDRVPDTGFTMLVAWLTGPGHLVRLPDREPRASTDQDAIDEGVEGYLADAGVPAPPRGHRWYQRPPHGHDTLEDLYAHVNTALRDTDPDGTAVHPHRLKAVLTGIVAELYPR